MFSPSFARWIRSAIVVRSLARTRAMARAQGAPVLQFATVCAEFRFRAVCKLSVNMSAYSRAYRTAATLLQRRWTKVVKRASLAARCHVFREAEQVLRSLIRRRSQETGLDGVARTSNASRFPSKLESSTMDATTLNAACLETQDESWLAAAETLSKAERLRTWKGNGDIENPSCSGDANRAARQR